MRTIKKGGRTAPLPLPGGCSAGRQLPAGVMPGIRNDASGCIVTSVFRGREYICVCVCVCGWVGGCVWVRICVRKYVYVRTYRCACVCTRVNAYEHYECV